MIVALEQSTIEAFARLDTAIAVISQTQSELPDKIVALVTTKDATIATLRAQLKAAQESDPATNEQIAQDQRVISDLQQQARERTDELNEHLNLSGNALQAAADAFNNIDLTDHSGDQPAEAGSDDSLPATDPTADGGVTTGDSPLPATDFTAAG